MNLPNDVKFILNTLNNNNFQGYIVGGCVRDYLLGLEPKDFDITTNAFPENIKSLFSHTVDTGIEHGTITIVINKTNYEVTTYRIDGEYNDNRHPENVIFSSKIEEDLSRRDFTMNAIAYNEHDGFVDEFKGKMDIKNKTIRCVGSPDIRFKEDALRMMRCIRFSAQLGFNIEEATFNSIKKNSNLIKNISIERIRTEFIKLLSSDYVDKLDLLIQTGLIDYFLPEIKHLLVNNFDKTITILKNLPKDTSMRLSLLFRNLDKNTTSKILKRLKLDNNTVKEVLTILDYVNNPLKDDYYETRKLMSSIDINVLRKILNMKFIISRNNKSLFHCKTYENIFDEIDTILSKGHCYNLKMLDINGDDIKNIFDIKDGKQIGQLLNLALDYVLKVPELNNKTILISILNFNLLKG